MQSSDKRTVQKKTKTLSIKGIPESASIITVSQACQSFISDVKGIRIIKRKTDGSRNALIDFITPKQCEDAKQAGDIKIGKETFPLYYARSSDTPNYNIAASSDKIYVKYPEDANEQEIIKMLGDVSIKKPENSKNFFFAICKDIDQQCNLVKKLDKKKVSGGELVVKVAIDKTRKNSSMSRISSN